MSEHEKYKLGAATRIGCGILAVFATAATAAIVCTAAPAVAIGVGAAGGISVAALAGVAAYGV